MAFTENQIEKLATKWRLRLTIREETLLLGMVSANKKLATHYQAAKIAGREMPDMPELEDVNGVKVASDELAAHPQSQFEVRLEDLQQRVKDAKDNLLATQAVLAGIEAPARSGGRALSDTEESDRLEVQADIEVAQGVHDEADKAYKDLAMAGDGTIGPEEELEEELTKMSTVFARTEDGKPAFYDYQMMGMFKDCAGLLRRVPGSKSKKVTAYKKVINACFIIQPRLIELHSNQEPQWFERPQRVQTPKGERSCLARSEALPPGTWWEFDLLLLNPKTDGPWVREMLDFGKFHGAGGWRNSGWGTYDWELVSVGE